MVEILSFQNPIIQLILSGLLGGFLGIRRELDTKRYSVHHEFMGFRSLFLVAFCGTLSTFIPSVPFLPLYFFVAFVILMAIAYYHARFKMGIQGITTELTAFCVFWVGVLVGSGDEGLFLAVSIVLFLSLINAYKYSLHNFIQTLTTQEWSGALQLSLISVFVLPLLSREAIDPWGVIIPFNIWFLVVLISGIGFFGYFLLKYLGLKGGIPLVGFLGSLTSSLAVTLSLSHLSKKFHFPNVLSGGILIAIATMQMRVAVVVYFLGTTDMKSFILVPVFMSLMSYMVGTYFCFFANRGKHIETLKKEEFMKLQSPFEILPALKFGLVFCLVLLALAIGKQYLGSLGVYMAAVFSGVFDIDSIVLSSLEALKSGTLSLDIAKNALMIALFMNTITKTIFVFFIADKSLLKRVFFGIFLSVFMGILAIVAV